MERETIEERVRTIADEVLAKLGIDLVDAEYQREPGGTVLRLFIDRDGGVSLDDCQTASRTLEPVFETQGVDELIPGPYNLEVSSPGLFRPLKRPRDYQRAIGRRIKVRTFKAVDERKIFVGFLDRVGEDHFFVKDGEVLIQIDLSNVAKANLEPELKF
jgi:ribosome maturation factor RimP